ncbi:MAG TPA: type IV secretion system protein [Bryobacteraceae bacterium]|nr:type IV secretion system protein [Bryobacteraceae bacterium]
MPHTAEIPVEILDSRTRRAKRQWEEAWSNPIAAKQNWQRIAFCEAAALVFAVWGLIHLGGMPKQVLYVVDRDRAGNVSYAGPVKPVDMDAKTWDLVKVQSLKKFIEYWRTVTADRTAQAADWDKAFLYIGDGSQAKAALNNWYEENDPIRRTANGEIVTVQYKTFDVEGQHTYGIWWQETTMSQGGQVISQKSWRARIAYDMHIPTSEAAREENSLGILITELSWEAVQ